MSKSIVVITKMMKIADPRDSQALQVGPPDSLTDGVPSSPDELIRRGSGDCKTRLTTGPTKSIADRTKQSQAWAPPTPALIGSSSNGKARQTDESLHSAVPKALSSTSTNLRESISSPFSQSRPFAGIYAPNQSTSTQARSQVALRNVSANHALAQPAQTQNASAQPAAGVVQLSAQQSSSNQHTVQNIAVSPDTEQVVLGPARSRKDRVLEKLKGIEYSESTVTILENTTSEQNAMLESWRAFVEEKVRHPKTRLFPKGMSKASLLTWQVASAKLPGSQTEALYLCVQGLRDKRDITDLQSALNQTQYRKEWKKSFGRICYSLADVIPLTARDAIQVELSSKLTLCGSLSKVMVPSGRTFTLAATIDVNGIMYALTVGHAVSDELLTPPPSPTFSADVVEQEGYTEEDLEEIQPALIIGEMNAGESVASESRQIQQPTLSGKVEVEVEVDRVILGRVQDVGAEWAMIKIEDAFLKMPNVYEGSIKFPDRSEADVLDEKLAVSTRSRMYLHVVATAPSPRPVRVLAGRSGDCPGRLIASSSFISMPSGDQIATWRVRFDADFNLQVGDSGALVIDNDDGTVYGHIIAFSPQRHEAFLKPLHQTLAEIRQRFKAEATLTSPFDCLANLSKSFRDAGDAAAARSFAREALLGSVLHASPKSQAIHFIKTSTLSEDSLVETLQSRGADIADRNAFSSRTMAPSPTDTRYSTPKERQIPLSSRRTSASGIPLSSRRTSASGSAYPEVAAHNSWPNLEIQAEFDVPFGRDVIELIDPYYEVDLHNEGELLPASYRDVDHALHSPENVATTEMLKGDLDVEVLMSISRYLWVAGDLKCPVSLTEQIARGRQLTVTERMMMHLVYTSNRIYLKPLPEYLLSRRFWIRHLQCPKHRGARLDTSSQETLRCKHCQLHRCASGFLFTYAALISRKEDFLLAKARYLIPEELVWARWRRFVAEILPYQSVHRRGPVERFDYGELSLSRLDTIVRFTEFRLSYSGLATANPSNGSSTALLLWGITLIVLVAMQLGLATDQLRNSAAFNAASYGFTVFSVVSAAAYLGLFLAGLYVYFTISLTQSWQMTTMRNSIRRKETVYV